MDRGWFKVLSAALPAALMLTLSLVPSGPFSAFPPVIVAPLTFLALLVGIGIRFKGSEYLGETVALLILFGGFFILKSVGIRPSRTDENIYFYMATRFVHGVLPYRDFFFAHPPGHLLFSAPFFVFGFNLVVAKLIPVMASALSGLFLYLTFRRTGYKTSGLVVTFLFLYAYQVLMGSTNMNGENLATLFLSLSVYSAALGRFVISGMAAGLALGCGLYSLAGVFAVGAAAYSFGKAKRLGKLPPTAFWLGVSLSVGLVFGVAWFMSGQAFIDGVFKYHLLKPPKSGRVMLFDTWNPFGIIGNYLHNLNIFIHGKPMLKSFYFHSPIYLAGMGYLAYAVVKAMYLWFLVPRNKLRPVVKASEHFDSLDGLAVLGFSGTILFILQFGALNEVYDFYMVPMLFFAVMPAGVFVVKMMRLPARYPGWGWLGFLAMIGIFWLYLPASYYTSKYLWPMEHSQAGEKVTYQWHDPIAFKPFAGLAKTLFYQDHRIKGQVTPFYLHYIWNKSLGFSRLDAVVTMLKSRATPGDTITGASDTAPLVALLSGLRMAGDEADTNSKRFSSGMITDQAFFKELCNDKLKFVISTSGSHFTDQFMTRNPLYSNRFRRIARFVDHEVLHFGRAFVIDVYQRVAPCGTR